AGVLLDLDEGADAGLVADRAAVEVDEGVDPDAPAQAHVGGDADEGLTCGHHALLWLPVRAPEVRWRPAGAGGGRAAGARAACRGPPGCPNHGGDSPSCRVGGSCHLARSVAESL